MQFVEFAIEAHGVVVLGSMVACGGDQAADEAEEGHQAGNDNRSHLSNEYYNFERRVVRLAFIFGW